MLQRTCFTIYSSNIYIQGYKMSEDSKKYYTVFGNVKEIKKFLYYLKKVSEEPNNSDADAPLKKAIVLVMSQVKATIYTDEDSGLELSKEKLVPPKVYFLSCSKDDTGTCRDNTRDIPGHLHIVAIRNKYVPSLSTIFTEVNRVGSKIPPPYGPYRVTTPTGFKTLAEARKETGKINEKKETEFKIVRKNCFSWAEDFRNLFVEYEDIQNMKQDGQGMMNQSEVQNNLRSLVKDIGLSVNGLTYEQIHKVCTSKKGYKDNQGTPPILTFMMYMYNEDMDTRQDEIQEALDNNIVKRSLSTAGNVAMTVTNPGNVLATGAVAGAAYSGYLALPGAYATVSSAVASAPWIISITTLPVVSTAGALVATAATTTGAAVAAGAGEALTLLSATTTPLATAAITNTAAATATVASTVGNAVLGGATAVVGTTAAPAVLAVGAAAALYGLYYYGIKDNRDPKELLDKKIKGVCDTLEIAIRNSLRRLVAVQEIDLLLAVEDDPYFGLGMSGWLTRFTFISQVEKDAYYKKKIDEIGKNGDVSERSRKRYKNMFKQFALQGRIIKVEKDKAGKTVYTRPNFSNKTVQEYKEGLDDFIKGVIDGCYKIGEFTHPKVTVKMAKLQRMDDRDAVVFEVTVDGVQQRYDRLIPADIDAIGGFDEIGRQKEKKKHSDFYDKVLLPLNEAQNVIKTGSLTMDLNDYIKAVNELISELEKGIAEYLTEYEEDKDQNRLRRVRDFIRKAKDKFPEVKEEVPEIGTEKAGLFKEQSFLF